MQSIIAVITSCTKSPNLESTFMSANNLNVMLIMIKQLELRKNAYIPLSLSSSLGSMFVVSKNLKKV